MQGREAELRSAFQEHVESLVQNKMEFGSIGIIHGSELDLKSFAAEEPSDGTSAQTADLYQIAKAFITTITA